MVPAPRDVIWAPPALADLDGELAERDPALLLEAVMDAAESLSTLSDRGQLVPEIDDGITRELFVHDFRLMYEVSGHHVLLAFVYDARDSETWQRERERR